MSTLATSRHPFTAQLLDLCQPYLEVRGGLDACLAEPLYRGMSIKDEQTIYNSQPYREPQSMPIVLHHRIDQWFHDQHGHCFRSVNAVFCTGSQQQASEFNDVCAIFPIGAFKYAWSASVADLTKHINARLNTLIARQDDAFWKKLLGYSEPRSLSIEEREIRVQALALCGDVLKEFEHHQTFQTDQLLNGIQSGNEIMLICQQYLALPIDQLHCL